jgi:hypothetical protein
MSVPFLLNGPGANLALFGVALGDGGLSEVARLASHVTLNFGIDLAGYGLLAIWLSWFLWNARLVSLTYWLAVVMLGIADAGFIYSLLLAGYSPLLEGLAGPIFYVLGVVFAGYGLKQQRAEAY